MPLSSVSLPCLKNNAVNSSANRRKEYPTETYTCTCSKEQWWNGRVLDSRPSKEQW